MGALCVVSYNPMYVYNYLKNKKMEGKKYISI